MASAAEFAPKSGADMLKDKNTLAFELQRGQELRFVIPEGVTGDEKVWVWKSRGTAEIFGTPLLDLIYCFRGPVSLGILCLCGDGARIHINGTTENPYVAMPEDTRTHLKLLNIHSFLELARRKAWLSHGRGPCTLLVGASSSGRSTVCRTLLAYASRACKPYKWTPIFVDLDCAKSDLSLPTTFAAVCFIEPQSPAMPFDKHSVFAIPFGFTHPKENAVFFEDRLEFLAEMCKKKRESNEMCRASGTFIVAPPWKRGESVAYFVQIARYFEPDYVMAMDDPLLLHELTRAFDSSAESACRPEIVAMTKSKGVLDESALFGSTADTPRYYTPQTRSIHDYFEGSGITSAVRFPFIFDVPFTSIRLCRVGIPVGSISSSLLSTDLSCDSLQKTVIDIMPDQSMVNHVFAIMSTWKRDEVFKMQCIKRVKNVNCVFDKMKM